MDENLQLKSILKFGKLVAIVPCSFRLRKRRYSTRIMSAIFAILLLVFSADVNDIMVFHPHVPSNTIALKVLISISNTLVYILATWLRLSFLERWRITRGLLNIVLHVPFGSSNYSKKRSPFPASKMRSAYKILSVLAILTLAHQLGRACINVIQDRAIYLQGVHDTWVIPSVAGLVMTMALVCKVFNECTITFGAFFTIFLLFRISILFDEIFTKFRIHSRFVDAEEMELKSRKKELMSILRDLYKLRRCLHDVNDISEAICLPVVLCSSLLCFHFSYCTITEACTYPRIVEFYRSLHPLMILLMTLSAGSLFRKRGEFWKETFRKMSLDAAGPGSKENQLKVWTNSYN